MRGGKRTGAGRKKGAITAATRRRKEIIEEATNAGITPLELSLRLMRALWAKAINPKGEIINDGKAMQAHIIAKDVAPFVHPKLATIEMGGKGGGAIEMHHQVITAEMTAKEAAEAYAASLHKK